MPLRDNHEDCAPGGDTGGSNRMEGLDWVSLTLLAPERSVMPGHLSTYRPARTQFASALYQSTLHTLPQLKHIDRMTLRPTYTSLSARGVVVAYRGGNQEAAWQLGVGDHLVAGVPFCHERTFDLGAAQHAVVDMSRELVTGLSEVLPGLSGSWHT